MKYKVCDARISANIVFECRYRKVARTGTSSIAATKVATLVDVSHDADTVEGPGPPELAVVVDASNDADTVECPDLPELSPDQRSRFALSPTASDAIAVSPAHMGCPYTTYNGRNGNPFLLDPGQY
uniref:Uncharacterized protein n=1 Tax=Glossina pallidipes TaxID=7398 RepID=A0A1B0A4F4_GLOPL